MRHLVSGKKLGRDINSRKALLNNLASSLFKNGQITTTLAKAKFARPYVEKMITSAKRNNLSLNRVLSSNLTPDAFKRLISEIGPGFKNRNGGFTRIIKIGPRKGDSAKVAKIELLELQKPTKAPKTIQKVSKSIKPRSKTKTPKKPNIKKSKAAKNKK